MSISSLLKFCLALLTTPYRASFSRIETWELQLVTSVLMGLLQSTRLLAETAVTNHSSFLAKTRSRLTAPRLRIIRAPERYPPDPCRCAPHPESRSEFPLLSTITQTSFTNLRLSLIWRFPIWRIIPQCIPTGYNGCHGSRRCVTMKK